MINLKHLAFMQKLIIELTLSRTDMPEAFQYIRSNTRKHPERRIDIRKAKNMKDYTLMQNSLTDNTIHAEYVSLVMFA